MCETTFFITCRFHSAFSLNHFVFLVSVVAPLVDASKGAVLVANTVTSSTVSCADGKASIAVRTPTKNKTLFEEEDDSSSARNTNRLQAPFITEALQSVEMQVFLR